MARFYGSVKGSRGEAHRLGGASSGLHTCAASYSGSVHVRLYDKDGEDWCSVSLGRWHGAGIESNLYTGPLNMSGYQFREARAWPTKAKAKKV